MKFSIETAQRDEYSDIRAIIAESYTNQETNTDGDEVDMVDRLRSYSDYQSEFEVVAKSHDHQVIGHALMIPVTIRSLHHHHRIVSIVEVSVPKQYRDKGVGQALVYELENRAQLAGYPAVSAIDNTDFFYELGYVAAENFNIFSTMPVAVNANLIKPLTDGGLFKRSGKIYYPEEFYGVRRSES
ncbi:GNAT family N-acetyltransferase [Lentilactobacillus farraginis]|uniref:Acetyltransferase n=1 Tax=Lentilactobacillus farraginis DSM 18382 = JCM 14108 TaxID=1423743 RepID=X0PAU2_9LACO|nr:N-acetyltransferase [Lentilactobacillus farraginis]KRM09214.1 acetyltransferase [Lentilactobacillus farraginis DSM 18382 = JCM 14108]GAF36658.1 predicted acetyltransferase [Lentilactobacillus farraginis DSM 18382 = JCM 14108]